MSSWLTIICFIFQFVSNYYNNVFNYFLSPREKKWNQNTDLLWNLFLEGDLEIRNHLDQLRHVVTRESRDSSYFSLRISKRFRSDDLKVSKVYFGSDPAKLWKQVETPCWPFPDSYAYQRTHHVQIYRYNNTSNLFPTF